MKDKREYYSQISSNFAMIALALFIFLVLLEVSFAYDLVMTEHHVVDSQLEDRRMEIEDTAREFMDSIYRFMITDEVSDYLDTPFGSPQFYEGELKLQHLIRQKSPQFNNSIYEIGISRPEESASVITGHGTFPKEYFLSEYGIEPTEELLEGRTNLVVQEDEDGHIDAILLSDRKQTYWSDIITYVHVPLKQFNRHLMDGIQLSIYSSRDGVLHSPDPKLGRRNLDEIVGNLPSGEKFQVGRYTLLPIRLPLSDSYLILSSRDTKSLMLISLLSLSLVILGILIYLIATRMKERLYEPVDQAVKILSEHDEEKPEDEFQFIIENCRKINTLHEELENAEKAQEELQVQQKYRALLRGVDAESSPDDETSYFTLAYATVSEEVDKPDQILSRIDNAVKDIYHFHSLRVSRTDNVYIYKSESEEQSYDVLFMTLQTLTFHLEGIEDVRFAITPARRGCRGLSDSFRKAEDIIQYRYRLRNRTVLTERDIPSFHEAINYSVNDERVLINALISDKVEAINVYDEIVRKNIDLALSIPQNEAKKFTYAMIGTLDRVFQSLKETPQSLIGHEIDFDSLYSDSDISRVLSYIRKILSEIIAKRRSDGTKEDDLILNEMIVYINRHYRENLMLIDLSTEFNLTPKYCSYLFKKLSNDTFKNYLTQLRIEKACQKLEENPRMKIATLSEEVGFLSSSTFIKAFSRIKGITPGTYAEMIEKNRYQENSPDNE